MRFVPRLSLLALLTSGLVACSDDGVPVPGPADRVLIDGDIRLDAADGGTEPADTGTEPLDGGEPTDLGTPIDTGVPVDGGSTAQPITSTPGTWTWVDFPGTACDDGTPTGIGVNASPTGSSNVLIFLNGGGACWNYETCVVQNTSSHGPFGAAQFNQIALFLGIGAFSRAANENPFRDWNMVFVPYCTGDLHAGSKVSTYEGGGNTVDVHHVGHTNVVAFADRLQATFPNAAKVVLSGSSAGGFGTVFNYDAVHAEWPTSRVYMLDDSGPLLPGAAIAPALRDAWVAAWGHGARIEALCGAACLDDYALGYGALSDRWPNERFALLSSLQDQTIRSYLQLTPQAFQTALLAAATDAIEPTDNFEYFFVPGSSHTMLGAPEQYTSSGTSLYTWLRQFVEDDAAWTSTAP